MEIVNITKMNEKKLAAFNWLILKKQMLKLIICSIILVICGILLLILKEFIFGSISLGIGSFLFPFLLLANKRAFKKMIKTSNFKDFEIKYLFTEEGLEIETVKENSQASESVKKEAFIGVVKKKNLCFLFIQKMTAYIIDMDNFENKEQFEKWLKTLKK